jgi:hypothetical protein
MADQFNDSIPAVTNQITEDVADIAESLGYLKDCFQRLCGASWSNTVATNLVMALPSYNGITDGTYNYTVPTLPAASLANAKIMLGTSSTIIWMYLNTAPPGWKALSTGADMVLGISGGSAAYNVNGGNPDSSATWTITGLAADAHTHNTVIPADANWADSGGPNAPGSLAVFAAGYTWVYYNARTLTSTGANATNVTHTPGWRPKASIGKLFQLDTA